MENFLAVPQVMPMKGINAGDAARMYTKSQGINLEDPYGANSLVQQVMQNLKSQGIEGVDPAVVKSLAEQALKSGLIEKSTDPVILPQPYVSPADFSGQYPQPLDPTEILTLCEEITSWRVLPEVVTDYQADRLWSLN